MVLKKQLIAAYLVIATLTGCAAKSIQSDFAFKNAPDKGIIVLSISHDLAGKRNSKAIFYMDGGLANGGSVLFSLDDAVPGIARGTEFDDSYGHLLVLALPAGLHKIDSWQITNGTGLRIFPKEKPKPLIFDVASGQIKYLGNLNGNLYTGKNIFGITIVANGYPEVLDRRERDIPIFEKKYPQLKGKIVVDLLPMGPWIQSSGSRKQVDSIFVPTQK